MTFNFLHIFKIVSTSKSAFFRHISSNNTVKLSLSQTTEQLKRSIDMKHSKSDNTVGVPFSNNSAYTVEASTQMYNKSESAQTGRATKKEPIMIATEYGNFLGQYNWTHIATVRPNFKLNERGAYKIGNTLFNRPNVNRVFYSTEYDRNLHQSHMHILFHSDHLHLTRQDLAMMIGYKNNRSYVSYLDNPADNEAVAMYCSKTIGKKQLCYDIML